MHFVVLPITTRDLSTIILNEYLHYLKAILDAQAQLVESLPSREWAAGNTARSVGSDSDNSSNDRLTEWPEADTWRAATAGATECQIKIQSELRYVKREFTWSKLAARDFKCVSRILRNILIPIAGMETIIQASDRVMKLGGWTATNIPKGARSDFSDSDQEKQTWGWLFGQLHEPFHNICKAMVEGLDYAFFTLGFTRKPAFSTKEELKARSSDVEGFTGYLQKTIDDFLKAREGPLKEWCSMNGMDALAGPNVRQAIQQRSRSQLYLILDVG